MRVRRWISRRMGKSPRVALLVDGPNVLRSEFDVDLDAIRESASDAGHVTLTRVYLDEHATPGLIKAAEAHGYEVIITSGDVDVKLAIDAMELVGTANWDVLAIASRDADFKPLLERAAYHGLRTLAIAPGHGGRSEALVQTADEAIVLDS